MNHRRKPPSDATVNRDLSVVRHVLFWGMDEGFIAHNPFARLRMTRERRKKRAVLSVADEIKLLLACAAHLVAIVILALDTGMRRGELLRQLWEDIDFDRRLIFVTHSKTAEGEMRPIPMTCRVFDLLTAMLQTEFERRARMERMKHEAPQQPRGLLFLFRGKAIRKLKTAWAGAIRRSGINRLRFHDLRHTFNTRLLEAGVIADTRKALMGHSDGSDVHAGYSHVEVHLLRDAIARLETWHSAKMSSLTSAGEVNSLPAPTGIDQSRKEAEPNEVQSR
jgi:integrase